VRIQSAEYVCVHGDKCYGGKKSGQIW
jgi:hypothetical protein